MAASPTITFFNANPLPVQVSVNNGSAFTIAGASGPNWVPQSSSSGGPTWSNTTPAPNLLAPGTNRVTVMPQGAMSRDTLEMTLPSVQWNSVQIYLFFSFNNVSWVVLNQGVYVTGRLELSIGV